MKNEDYRLMVEARKRALLSNGTMLDRIRTAMEHEVELSFEEIMNMFTSTEVVPTDGGFNLYVYATKDVWAFSISFLCADFEYSTFIVDSINYPYEGYEYAN